MPEDSIKYSIPVCHYNMVNTVSESLESILSQTDSRFEILVIDGGSTDGSLRKLRNLSDQYSNLRIICTAKSPHSGLGEERNLGVRESRGEYVLLQLDADNRYKPVIQDFVSIYEEFRRACDDDLYFAGFGINIAPRDFLLSHGPYRPGIHRGEDQDMWRRFLADNSYIHLRHNPIFHSIGYDPGKIEATKQHLSVLEGHIRTGVSFRSLFYKSLQKRWTMTILEGFLLPIAFIRSLLYPPRYDLPDPYQNAYVLKEEISANGYTLKELEEKYKDFDIPRERLSENGKDIFLHFEG